MDSLTDAETIESLKTRLEALPSTIDEQYDSIMKRIMNGGPESAKLAKEGLMFTTTSLRPLSSIELQHALAARIGDPGPDRERVPLEDRLVEVCAGMVVLERKTKNIKLVHKTTKAYFSEKLRERNLSLSFSPQDARNKIVETCMIYINFDEFGKGECATEEALEARVKAFPFIAYAVMNLVAHFEQKTDEADENVRALLMKFLRNEAKKHTFPKPFSYSVIPCTAPQFTKRSKPSPSPKAPNNAPPRS
jgi:hypothetical protein